MNKVVITVLKREFYPELAEEFLAAPVYAWQDLDATVARLRDYVGTH